MACRGDSTPKVLLVGVGNRLFADEGLGPEVIGYMERNYVLPVEGLELIDAGTVGLTLTEHLARSRAVVIVDAVKGGMPAGYIYRVELGGGRCPVKPLFSLHQLGVCELVEVARLNNPELEAVLIGMEPQLLAPAMGLSAVARLRLPLLAERVAKELLRFSIGLERRH